MIHRGVGWIFATMWGESPKKRFLVKVDVFTPGDHGRLHASTAELYASQLHPFAIRRCRRPTTAKQAEVLTLLSNWIGRTMVTVRLDIWTGDCNFLSVSKPSGRYCQRELFTTRAGPFISGDKWNWALIIPTVQTDRSTTEGERKDDWPYWSSI